jgi:hypothetical protein
MSSFYGGYEWGREQGKAFPAEVAEVLKKSKGGFLRNERKTGCPLTTGNRMPLE